MQIKYKTILRKRGEKGFYPPDHKIVFQNYRSLPDVCCQTMQHLSRDGAFQIESPYSNSQASPSLYFSYISEEGDDNWNIEQFNFCPGCGQKIELVEVERKVQELREVSLVKSEWVDVVEEGGES